MTAVLRGGPTRVTALTPAQVRALGEGDIVVLDRFLGDSLARAAARALRRLARDGTLTPARVGRERLHRPAIRGDHTAWYQQVDLPDGLATLWPAFSALQDALNTDAWLGLQRFELQLACYPGDGARYAPHTDTFVGDPARRVTAILYLNPDWRPPHGGQLRAHTPRGSVLVEPHLDRLLIFLSDRVPHEVLPTHAPRFAATAWYRGSEAVPLLPDG